MGKQYADTTTRERAAQNMFSYWYPKVQGHGIDTPKSLVFQLPRSGTDGEVNQELYKAFFMEEGEKDIATIQKWLDVEVMPALEENEMWGRLFVKNGTFSNKFWADGSCIVERIDGLAEAVANINYGALCVGAGGLGELVVRQFISYNQRKTPCIYNGLPLRPEFRVFYDFDERKPIFVVNYWDAGYVEDKLHDLTDRLVFQSQKEELERFYESNKDVVVAMVEEAMADVDLSGAWSVDIMWDSTREKYWLIDMAVAETSTYWDWRPGGIRRPEQNAHNRNEEETGEGSSSPILDMPQAPEGEKEVETTPAEPASEAEEPAIDRYAGWQFGRRETENRFSFWFEQVNLPTTKEAGLDIPKTLIIKVPVDVIRAFADYTNGGMHVVEEWFHSDVVPKLKEAGLDRRLLFIKNGAFSNKFRGNLACLTTSTGMLSNFISIQQTAEEIFMGYDGMDELIVRERIMYDSATTACIYHGLPLRPEYRAFYDFDAHRPIFIANYWDETYGQMNDATDKIVFQARAPYIKAEYEKNKDKVLRVVAEAMKHVTGLSGPWSIDVMQDNGQFFLIDMAVAEQSAYWERRPGANDSVRRSRWTQHS